MPQKRQNRGGGLRSFPSSSPMSKLTNNYTRPTIKYKRQRRPRPQSSKAPIQRTVQLGKWSSAIPVQAVQDFDKPHIYPQYSSQTRTSLFPADLERNYKPKHSVPRLSQSLAKKTKYGTLKLKNYESQPVPTSKELQLLKESKRKRKIKTRRHKLEREVLSLLACDIVDLASTREHQNMVKNAKNAMHRHKDVDPYELPQSLFHRKKEKVHKPGPDPNLIDVRTHDKIFRTFNPFEKQWLDLWGSQNIDKGNCNAHCVRSIYKWNELKEKGRQEVKRLRKLTRLRNQRRRNHEGKKKMDADFIKIVEETKVLLNKPL